MLWKKIYLTLHYFRWTILFLLIAGIISVYFQVNTLGTFILTAFVTWLQAFIDKVREIGHQLELEYQAKEEPAAPESGMHIQRELSKDGKLGARELLVDWKQIFAKGKKAFIVLASILMLLTAITFIYLYIYF